MRLLGLLIGVVILALIMSWYLSGRVGTTQNPVKTYEVTQDQLKGMQDKVNQYQQNLDQAN
jgi:uncharacterized membrane-anchored protein YhcB (DUF1043 family)